MDISTDSAWLKDQYALVLQNIDRNAFAHLNEDCNNAYSGIFLPFPFESYYAGSPKIMLVGRETAYWNTKNGKNKMTRIINALDSKEKLDEILAESQARYENHLYPKGVKKEDTKLSPGRSHFKQYYFKLAKAFNLLPKDLIYANLFAWDYNGKSPRNRPEVELTEVTRISCMLLSKQIELFKPDFIVFATGYAGIDRVIQELIKLHPTSAYEKLEPSVKHRFWTFKLGQSICFRIAHPRAMGSDYSHYRQKVIEEIRKYHSTKELK